MGTYDGSIFNETKKSLGLAEGESPFDTEIMMHINSAFGSLHQLGLGPVGGYAIEGDTETWADFTADDLTITPVKTYVHLSVRSVFDPPSQSWTLTALKEQIEKLEFRLNIAREDALPDEVVIPEEPGILDGGVI